MILSNIKQMVAPVALCSRIIGAPLQNPIIPQRTQICLAQSTKFLYLYEAQLVSIILLRTVSEGQVRQMAAKTLRQLTSHLSREVSVLSLKVSNIPKQVDRKTATPTNETSAPLYIPLNPYLLQAYLRQDIMLPDPLPIELLILFLVYSKGYSKARIVKPADAPPMQLIRNLTVVLYVWFGMVRYVDWKNSLEIQLRAYAGQNLRRLEKLPFQKAFLPSSTVTRWKQSMTLLQGVLSLPCLMSYCMVCILNLMKSMGLAMLRVMPTQMQLRMDFPTELQVLQGHEENISCQQQYFYSERHKISQLQECSFIKSNNFKENQLPLNIRLPKKARHIGLNE